MFEGSSDRFRFSWRVRLGILTIWACTAAGAAAGVRIGAGDDRDGWFVLNVDRGSRLLNHIPAEAPPGTVRRVMALTRDPVLMAAGDGRLVMVFAPNETPDTGKPPAGAAPIIRPWPVRELRVERDGRRGPSYSALSVLPHLGAAGVPIGLAVSGDQIWALSTGDDPSAATLQVLRNAAWEAIALPGETVGAWRLTALGGRLALLARASEPGSHIHVMDGPASPFPTWRRVPLHLTGGDAITAGGHLITIESALSEVCFRVARSDDKAMISWSRGISEEVVIVPSGGNINICWLQARDGRSPSGRIMTDISTVAGRSIYNGPALTVPPVGRTDLESVGLMLASLLASVLVFVFRPADSRRDSVVLPEGYVLATQTRRLLATLFDWALAFWIASMFWDVSVTDLVMGAISSGVPEGPRPLLTAALALFLASSLTESIFGCSLGKRLTGCEVRSTSGRRASMRQIIARNCVKAFCPPLAPILVLGGSNLFGTFVIMRRPDPV